jgi:hypothetical protein
MEVEDLPDGVERLHVPRPGRHRSKQELTI